MVQKLWTVFIEEDASLVEVNPLARLGDGTLEALDGKVTLDANADFRHPDHDDVRGRRGGRPARALAKEKDLNYVKLDGEVGIIGNGAGLVMSTLDVVAYAGEEHGGVKPANFLDIGGGASAEVMANGLEIVLGDPRVTSVFVNVFGGITSCDAVADGIVAAFRLLEERGEPVTKPLVVRLDGNNADEGRRILDDAGPAGVERVDTMDGAADRAAELAAAASRGADCDGDLPHRREPDHRAGHDRLGGLQAHPPDARRRLAASWAASTPARPARGRLRRHRRCRCSAPSPRR